CSKRLDVGEVFGMDGGVYLGRNPKLPCALKRPDCEIEASGGPSERVMHFGGETIQAHGQAAKPRVPELDQQLSRDQRSGRGSEPHVERRLCSVSHQFYQVGALGWVTACQDDKRDFCL